MSSYISREMRRVLGAGVSRLMDGDLRDRSDAEAVIRSVEDEGYVYDHRGSFVSRNAILVNGSMSPDGVWTNDLTDTEKAEVIRAQGALLPELNALIDESRYLALPDLLVDSMANCVRTARRLKGLRFEPVDL